MVTEDFFHLLFKLLLAHGYLGAFLISVLGSLIPFIPVPYLIPIVLMARKLDPFLLGISTGAGGAVGKLTSYALGRFGRRFLGRERRRRMDVLGKAIGKYGAIAVFLFALTPLPDDVIYIPMGLTGLSVVRFMIANMLGKIVLSWVVAYAGRLYFDIAGIFLGEEGGLISTAIALTAMIVITIVLLKVDWEKVVEEARTGGISAGIKAVFRTIINGRKLFK
ncbi:MAG: VTT domain-containing protein [Aigarchaeota archaeon]|nr:VTT domain-containing protein [Aigarchaeota archaeon]